MTTFRYAPPPRRYRRPRYSYGYRPRYRSRGNSGALPVVITVAVLAAAAGTGTKAVTTRHAHHAPARPAANAAAAAKAISYARGQLGKPYLWGGTGPGAFDCSGLMLMAYRSAGVDIPRTSQAQYAGLPHVPAGQVVPGDLVFFAGSDGTATAPGHVGLVIGKNTMIEAYATGTPVRVTVFGTSRSPAGDGTVVGFADPAPAPASPVTAPAQMMSTASANVALGKALAASYGWGSGRQWTCLDELWTRESGWRMVWNYQGSGAYGIPQALPASKMASAGPDYMTSPATQIRWGLGYIASAYRTPCAAWAFETSHTPNWY